MHVFLLAWVLVAVLGGCLVGSGIRMAKQVECPPVDEPAAELVEVGA